MPELLVTRDKVYADRSRDYRIIVDDKEIGKIGCGETKKFQIEAGEHTIQAKIDWCRTEKISFNTDQMQPRFSVKSNLGGWKVFLALFYLFQPSKWIVLSKS